MKDFKTLGGFIKHLQTMEQGLHTHEAALEKVASRIEKDAKDLLGSYHSSKGPFKGWAPLAQFTMDERTRKGFPANEPLLVTGEMRDSIDHVAKSHDAEVGSNSEVAVVQEMGNDHVPPRSFLGLAAIRKADWASKQVAKSVAQRISGVRRI